jgi:hypothetical protein
MQVTVTIYDESHRSNRGSHKQGSRHHQSRHVAHAPRVQEQSRPSRNQRPPPRITSQSDQRPAEKESFFDRAAYALMAVITDLTDAPSKQTYRRYLPYAIRRK